MAGSLNKVCLLGNLGKDPEIRTLQNGNQIANITLATEESWTDKASGERKSKTEWHRVVVFNPGLVGVIEKYVKKGSKIYIEGALQTRKWTDQGGTERYSTEVVLQNFGGQLILLTAQGQTGGTQAPEQTQARARPADRNKTVEGRSFDDEEIPF